MNAAMKKVLVCAFLGANACAVTALASDDDSKEFRQQQQVLRITGGGAFYPCEIPATELGTTNGFCADADIIDLKTGEVVGTFTDALADQKDTPDGGFVITSTPTFRLPGGDITSRARVAVIPVSDAARNLNAAVYNTSHVTAGIPTPGGANNIMSGTGRFRGATGQARVSGAISLTTPGSEFFNCLFVLDLNVPRKK